MPRRKRNRKNRRKIYKQQQQQNTPNVPNTISKTPVQETPKKEDSETFMTLPNLVTPIRTPNTSLYQTANASIIRSHSVTRTTPVNFKKDNANSNLRKLFDDCLENESIGCLNNVTPKCSRNIRTRSPFSESYINNLNRHVSSMEVVRNRVSKSVKMRSNSSVSKLRSPGLDKIPIMVDVATQTVYFDNSLEKRNSSDVYLQSCINIFETPKISQMERLEKAFINVDTPSSQVLDNVINRTSEKNVKYVQNFNDIIFPNSYVSPKIIQKAPRRNSIGDMSFFSSQLKTSSTPIAALQKKDKILENMAKNILTAQLDRKLSNFSPKTPNDKNLNSNRCEDKVHTQKINKLDSCVCKRRMYNSASPKKLKQMTGKWNNSSKNNSTSRNDSAFVLKTFSPARGSFNRSNNVLNVSNSGSYARFMTNVKKLHSRYSTRWFNVVKNVCCGLGITIKQKLSSFCFPTEDTENLTTEQQKLCSPKDDKCYGCRKYKEKISSLFTKVDTLNKELSDNKEKVMSLSEEMGKVKEELYDVMKKKIKEIEDKLDNRLLMPLPATLGALPPPPPPPPIPPPPPPLPNTISTPVVTRITRSAKNVDKKIDKKNCESSRPVISLNDILNVKLKKISDQPILIRRATQPIVSVEMLNQVKLRPASRPDTPSSINDVSTPSSLSSSPASSLTKLLSNVDPTVRRLKRLRRVSGYSLDDSRKHLLRRERFGGEDVM